MSLKTDDETEPQKNDRASKEKIMQQHKGPPHPGPSEKSSSADHHQPLGDSLTKDQKKRARNRKRSCVKGQPPLTSLEYAGLERSSHLLFGTTNPQAMAATDNMASAASSSNWRNTRNSHNTDSNNTIITSTSISTSTHIQNPVDPNASLPLCHQSASKRPLPPKVYDAYYSPEQVQTQLDAGYILRGVLRINPKNRTDAYVSLDESPSEKCLRNYPQLQGYDVGSGDDIYICGEPSRNRAISGDTVAIKILSNSNAKGIYRTNRLANDRRIDQLKERRRNRLDRMAAAASNLPSNQSGNSQSLSDTSYSTNDSKEPIAEDKKVYGVVIAIISHNSDRSFTGNISAMAPTSALKNHFAFVGSLGTSVVWFKPVNTALPYMIIPKDGAPEDFHKKRFCTVRMDRWGIRDPFPSAVFVKDLGERGTIDIETHIILEENGVCTDPFTPSALRCLPSSPWEVPIRELERRTDLRKSCIFTIDPPTARDLDDAVSCTRLPNGNMLVGVHIADVSFFVRPNTSLDIQARQRATTTYLVQRAYPMLPSMLCEDLCSLNPGVDRLAFSVMWEMDPATATVKSTWFGRTVINSACKLAYDDAQHVIDGNHLSDSIPCYGFSSGKAVPASHSRKTQIEASIIWFYKLSKIMRQRRFDNGALSLNSVKLSFELDEAGEPIDCWPYAIKDSNRLIEEFMLLANMSVAARIEATFPDASLLRRHSPPLSRRLIDVCKQLEASGVHLSPGSSGELQESLSKVTDPEVRFTIEEMLTGPMQRALYFSTHSIKDKAGYRHYALNVPLYTHFTSPIRRYADIIVHRTLEASLGLFGNHVVGDHPLLPQYYSPFFPKTPPESSLTASAKVVQSLLIPKSRTIAEIAHQCNLRKDAAKKAQDASSKLYLVHYLMSMSKRLVTPDVISLGVVTKVTQEKIIVTLPTFGIEGTLYMDRLADRKNQVLSIDARDWKLRLWTVEAASVTLVWEAGAPKHKKQTLKESAPNSVADLSGKLSALVIDDNGHGSVHFGHKQTSERITQRIQIFSKVTVSVLATKSPPDLSVRLIRGSKALVLDKEVSGALSMIVDFGLLKEHGVEKIFLLEAGPLDTGATKGVFYFTLPHVQKMRIIAEQVKAGLQGASDVAKEYSLQLVPRRTLLCERVLEEEGVLGDITLGEYHMDFIPLEDDVLSLELPATFKELYLDGDFSSIQYTARALMRLQGLFGFFPRIVGKGDFSQILADSLTRMRLELMSTGLSGGNANNALAISSTFDSVVIIDRAVDLTTPLLTQLTYEGLISETFGIIDGSVTLGSNASANTTQSGASGSGPDAHSTAKRKRITLNNSDSIYRIVRGMNFSAVGNMLSKISRQLQDSYESRHKAKTVQEIRSFVGKLGGLQSEHQSLKIHVSLAETVLKRTQSDDFSAILDIEQTLVGGGDLNQEQLAYFNRLFSLADLQAPVPGVGGELKGQVPSTSIPNSIHKVLRLLCLYSLWRGSHFKQKTYEAWYEEIIAGFGYHHSITIDNLGKVGLLSPPSSTKPAAPSAQQRLTSANTTGDSSTAGLLNCIVPSTKPRNPVHTNQLSFLRKTLNLVVSDVRENDPDDISFVYSGYAPISIRLLQCLVRDPAVYTTGSSSRYAALLRPLGDSKSRPAQRDGQNMGGVKSGWGGWDDVLSELPGETVDVVQSPSDRDTDAAIADEMVKRLGEKAPATLVVFLGGCTFTEIAALRLLSQQHNHRYIAATTQIINGNSFLDPLIQKLP
ncbi:hypothetical protein EV178_000208 [Coemansia sp. RSA 1646]|nr:hypothetical protein EV178_000208 [Coemansia sp. RSA 1646]